MSVGLRTVERSGIAPGDAAAVIGCGPIGLSLIAWMAARGIEPIVAADFSAQRRAHAAALGAHAVVDPRTEPVVDAWRRVDGIRPLVIFEAVGVPGMLDEVIYAAPPRSRVVVAGVCMQPDTIRPLLAVVKELEVRFVFGSEPDEFAAALHAIAEGEVDVSSLVTGIVGLDGVPDAFEMLGRAEHHVKVLVEPGGPTAVSPVTSETPPAA